jgi:NDP-sugar pyrophosphorylase family protein
LPLAGRPLLSHIVESVPPDVSITASTNAAFADSLHAWAAGLGRPVTVVVEQTRSDSEKLGALGAIAQWLESAQIHEDVLLLAGDNYLGFRLVDFLAAYHPGVPLLAVREIGDLQAATQFGTAVLEPASVRMAAYEEKPKVARSSLVSTTCAVLPAHTFPIIQACAQTHPDKNGVIWEAFLKAGIACEAFPFTEAWFDIGAFDAYLEATRTLVGDRAQIDASATCTNLVGHGSVVVGPRCQVRDAVLTDVVLFEDCEITDCVLERCVVDRGCVLRGVDLSGKMLRQGTRLTRS